MGTIETRLKLLRTLIWVGTGLAMLLVMALVGSEAMILLYLPTKPEASLIALLQTIQTGLVGALGVLIGAIGSGIGSYFSFRSAKETSGDDTPSAP